MNNYYQQQQSRESDIYYERDIANLLATIIRKEQEIEQMRSLLCENDKFEVTEAFRALDTHDHGYLTSNDLKIFLSRNHIMTREKECDFLVYVYARNHQSISFMEFLKIVLPKQDDNLKEQCLSRRKFRSSNQKATLPFYLEEQLSKIFELEISYIRETEAQKMDIMNNYGWNYRESFKRISRPGQYHIDKQAFYAFMIKNQITEFNENSFKFVLIRFNKDDNDLITMDEFCHAIFPSDFIAENPFNSERSQNPYFRYVKGGEQDFNEYITGTNRQEDDSDRFNQEDYIYHNDVDNYSAQKKRVGIEQPRKFLKTSVQYENTQNVRPMIGVEYVNLKDDYPTLNQYLMKIGKNQPIPNSKSTYLQKQNYINQYSQQKNNYAASTLDDNYQSQRGEFYQSQRSPVNYLSSQKNLFLDYDQFNKQQQNNLDDYIVNQPRQRADPKNFNGNQLNINENHSNLANSYLLKSQVPNDLVRNSMPPKPIGHNASTAKFDNQPNYRSQYTGNKDQPFRAEDFVKSRYYQ